ncbi:DUF6212 domain-containing protein [Paracoccus sp. TOH]|uniref:DUF6212 domain-containing protein n=1 Tax=Paracoccus sp. TOH TaxID=1263728 RepID=UPI0025B27EED|nr:DUF6212 domain-containing protein [Paracoccus sp. TOH]WJS86019.1 hypothetical protein NBE95_11460 [Paracoccus sp. TOH]
MTSFIVDGRVQQLARGLLPENVEIEALGFGKDGIGSDYPVDRPFLAAIALAGHAEELRTALAGSPHARLALIELDPRHPDAGRAEMIRLLLGEIAASHRQIGEARAVAAQLRSESIGIKTRLRDIENLLYSLGNPQLSNALSWQPTGALLALSSGQTVVQNLPINAVSLTAIDLWFPQVVLPVIAGLTLAVEDAAGLVYPLRAVSPDMGLETGWMRFCLAEPIAGIGRDCRLKLTWTGPGSITLGLGQPVPDPRFRATPDTGTAPAETLAMRAWQSLGGVRLPACTPALSSGSAASIHEAEFIAPSSLPSPELFAQPPVVTDHVSTAFWEREDAILVHPSRSGPACAIIRGVDLAGLSHVSALVTVGHVRAPSLNFAVGVAPHGLVDEDGFWQRRIGPWMTGMPAQGWGQVHCIPAEPITGKADILLAASLATDMPNDLSWGLFRGFRFSRGATAAAANRPDVARGYEVSA